ncbi:MAG: MurR/RpiR family transcriptional regulator [Deltaproteobacteria bacterium]|nr:MurR/RpiR family transcriptional regulator [Deltaproteobacteria bacterium]
MMADHNKIVPPQTLEDLKSFLWDLRQGKSVLPHLGQKSTKTLAKMVDAPNYAAVTSINKLAKDYNINASTLTRLAKKLGYSGFSSFQDIFREYIANKKSFYSLHAQKLLSEKSKTTGKNIPLLHAVSEAELVNVQEMIENVDEVKLETAINLLATAPRVRVLGLRQSFSIAHFFSYTLKLIRKEVSLLGRAGHTLAEDIAELSRNDLVFIITLHPYTTDTVTACAAIRERGIKIIALTDSYGSPVVSQEEHTFIVSSEGPFYFNGIVASVVFLESLLTMVARDLGKKAVKELKLREKLFTDLNVEF